MLGSCTLYLLTRSILKSHEALTTLLVTMNESRMNNREEEKRKLTADQERGGKRKSGTMED